MQVRFKGGATKSLSLPMPPTAWQLRKTKAEIVTEIDGLLEQCTDSEIAAVLNKMGWRSSANRSFSAWMIYKLRTSHKLLSRTQRLRVKGLLNAREIAELTGTKTLLVDYWRQQGLLEGILLRLRGATRDDMHAVVAAEVGQLRIDLRIKPVGLEHRRFHIVEVEQQGRTAQIAETIFQAANERLGVLPSDRLAIGLARITQYHPQDPTAALLTLAVIDRRSQAEIQLEFFSRLAFQTPDPLGLGRSQLAHKALHRLVGIGKAVFAHQILVNTLRAEPDLDLRHDHFGQGFALTLSPNAIAGGRNGWFYFTSFFKPGGRNGRFCFTSLLQARRSKWLVLLTVNIGRRSLDRSQARVRSVVGTSLGRLNCKSLFAGSLLGSSTCSIGPASGLFRGAVFCSKKWLVLKPLISTFSGWF